MCRHDKDGRKHEEGQEVGHALPCMTSGPGDLRHKHLKGGRRSKDDSQSILECIHNTRSIQKSRKLRHFPGVCREQLVVREGQRQL